MRRHHQEEDHVVDDVAVGELVAVLVGRMTQHAQQVVPALLAACLVNPCGEVVLEQLAGAQAATT